MGKIFKGEIRLRAGGTMNTATGVMTGGVVLGHFLVTAELSVERGTLTAQMANGPTTQKADEDSSTATIRIEALKDSVQNRNLTRHAVGGGYVEIVAMTGVSQEEIDYFGPWEFGPNSSTTGREAAGESVTLVGTNLQREAAWIDSLTDLPAAT